MQLNILLTGVGGQGILTSAAILAKAAINSGENVTTAETHGMAQRGGSVEVHVRIGDVLSPLIPLGSADFVISLELSEILRYVKYCGEQTTAVVNTGRILPLAVNRGEAMYPELEEVKNAISWMRTVFIDANRIAEEAGSVQAGNVVVLGAFCRFCKFFTLQTLEEAVLEVLPEKVHDINIKALKMGYKAVDDVGI
ncbi:MAG: indolepyruvate ferredoxin oxidoreductase subunit beta [Archaeoglobus sp.]|jgi:indolepyruvate ferredoxin oxidoreductase beta subunit|nr:MAG: indolepyruvate ferredoxin oxidoreductase subunit beta [Archaeoglobus sp.]